MNDHEESEIVEDFGQILRTVMGSGMQAAEQGQRRAAAREQERQMTEAREQAVAQKIGQDFGSERFWKTSGSEAIADRMTLALELANKHGASSEAARAFVTGADRIRNQYGINVEDINKDHPTAAVDRHQALRDALDDYLAGQRVTAEGTALDAAQERQTVAAEPVEQSEKDAALERENESAHLVKAEQHEGEETLDRTNTESAEGKEIIEPRTPDGLATKAPSENPPLNETSHESQRILAVWREKSGGKNNPSLAQPPTLNAPKAASSKRPKVLVGQAQGRSKEQGLSR